MGEDPALERLEVLVSKVSERLRAFHEEKERLLLENRELRDRLQDLERDADGERAVSAERDELIARVERLATGLDELIATVDDG